MTLSQILAEATEASYDYDHETILVLLRKIKTAEAGDLDRAAVVEAVKELHHAAYYGSK